MNLPSDPVDMLLLRLGARPEDLRILRRRICSMLDARSVVSPIDAGERPAREARLGEEHRSGRTTRQ
jgi:hypothetical protein